MAAPVQPVDIMLSNPAGLATADSQVLQFGFLGVFAQGHFSSAVNVDQPLVAGQQMGEFGELKLGVQFFRQHTDKAGPCGCG